ncbi:TetR/AcrR family transcriptional regulator [Janthinobacterium agaricidamnosum]|uniref:Bacterial regulatory s, tetR family protein n=1 Tax=Janthinobacterium agaricidamnosum NBRC 102515 = DSM 9628 TaxID=1349767 RepID=W0V7H1_9BURK|nr:TetR/AcrR family transcriptional regulator [Janthinobacterium agaricidamnosum]CDG83530.1 bacterial regulatory s, tetR family protein [Janthinobacterium agaricidamnosum NBRC 102515 = DSM 9628]
MSRPKSEDKRNAIMAAAIRVIASQGLGAPTATIAKEAGVANGSLFNYFDTKAELFSQLYVELKQEVMSSAMQQLPAGADLRAQTLHVWTRWMQWATSWPDKRKAMAQLSMSDDISPASRAAGQQASMGIVDLIQRTCAGGPLRDHPLPFIFAVVSSLSGATMDYMIAHPAQAQLHCDTGFAMLWRALT